MNTAAIFMTNDHVFKQMESTLVKSTPINVETTIPIYCTIQF